MNAYFFGISEQEKQNILDKHKEVYNGYQTLNPSPVSNNQPLYTQDFANDKGGLTVNNKGEVMKYTNMGINESIEEGVMCEQCGLKESDCKCGTNEEMCEQGCSDITEQEDIDYSDSTAISAMGDNIWKSKEFQNLISNTDSSEFGDEFEYADNMISWSLSDYYDSPFYDDLYDYIKQNYSEYLFDIYQSENLGEFNDFDDENDEFDMDEMTEDIDDGEVASDVEPAYQFQSHGPEDVYGTLKDYDKEHPHHDYDSMEDVAEYDPSSDLENMFPDLDFGKAFSDEPSDTFQHDAGDVDRMGDEGLGQDTENDMDLGKASSGYNFYSGGFDGTGDDDEFNMEEQFVDGPEVEGPGPSINDLLDTPETEFDVDDDLKESFNETRKLTLEMFQRLSKFN
jgi:hypothetical protein